MSNRTIIEINHDLPAPVRVVEEMARAMYDGEDTMSGDAIGTVIFASEHLFPTAQHQAIGTQRDAYMAATREVCRQASKHALMVLRRHGFITLECINAIYAEEDANGEPRSSAMQVGK